MLVIVKQYVLIVDACTCHESLIQIFLSLVKLEL
jgi:hypothetical protein